MAKIIAFAAAFLGLAFLLQPWNLAVADQNPKSQSDKTREGKKGCRWDMLDEDKIPELFEAWVLKHEKVYVDEEERLHRLRVFENNVKWLNKRSSTVSL